MLICVNESRTVADGFMGSEEAEGGGGEAERGGAGDDVVGKR